MERKEDAFRDCDGCREPPRAPKCQKVDRRLAIGGCGELRHPEKQTRRCTELLGEEIDPSEVFVSENRCKRDNERGAAVKLLESVTLPLCVFTLRPCAFFLVTFFSPNLRGRAKKTKCPKKKKTHWLSVPDHLTNQ